MLTLLKLQQKELAAKLDGNFAAKMKLHMSCFIVRMAVHIIEISTMMAQ